MAKRFYKENEMVWVVAEKTKGKVLSLDVANLSARISVKQKDGSFHEKTVKFMEIDKLKSTLSTKPLSKTRWVTQKKDTVLFAKVRETAQIPSKEVENAGYDVYADFPEDSLYFEPHQTILVPTGIASSLLDKYALIVKERGSTGVRGMAVRAGVIDSGYRNEIFVAITNENPVPLAIAKEYTKLSDGVITYPYTKAIAQLLLVEVPKVNVKEITYEQLKAIPSKRGDGNLGSSDK